MKAYIYKFIFCIFFLLLSYAFLLAETGEEPVTSYTVARVEIKLQNNKLIKGYIPVYEIGERGNLKFDHGQDILAIVNNGKPIVFTDKYYEIPGVDRVFPSGRMQFLSAADIREIKFIGWEDFTGINGIYAIPEKQIKKAIKIINSGVKPVIYDEFEVKYSFIPIDGKISNDELEMFIFYWMKYHIKKPKNLFCYPECQSLSDCENISDKFSEDLAQGKEMLEKLSDRRVINVPEAAYPVYERVKYFSGLLEFYTAVNAYWTDSDPFQLVKCIKTRYPDAASMEPEIIDSRNSVCQKMEVIRKAFYACGIDKRDRQPYDMFIDADKKMIEKGYYIRLARQVSDP